MALIGVATILLSGCSETGQFGNTFGTPVASSTPRVDRTPTGSVSQGQSPNSQISNFFAEAFRPFDSQPPAEALPRRAAHAAPKAPYAAPQAADRPPVPPAPIASAPLAPPSGAASYPAAAATPSAPRPTYALRPNPNAVGGWTAQGGTPIVVAQGETADIIAQRYGVPTNTLLQINGYASRAQVQPGSRMIIPVYSAGGARTAAAPAKAAPHSLVSEEIEQAHQTPPARVAEAKAKTASGKTVVLGAKPRNLATEMFAAPSHAERQAHLAQEKTPEKAAQQKAAQERVAQEKLAKQAAEKARLAQLKAEQEQVKLTRAEAAKASAAETAKKAADAHAAREAAKLAAKNAKEAAKLAAAKAAQPPVQAAAAPAKVEETTRVAKAEARPADATASLQPASASTADSANPEFRWPARGRVIQGFGNGGNDGINIAVPEGTQVKAAENGVVAYAGSELKGYGNLVLIRHPNGFVSAYANNGSLNVKRGDTVKRGQVIALSGQTGNVSSPQLHFELRKGSKPVDPSNYLAGL